MEIDLYKIPHERCSGGEEIRNCYRISLEGKEFYLRVYSPDYSFQNPQETMAVLRYVDNQIAAEKLAPLHDKNNLIPVKNLGLGYLTLPVPGEIPTPTAENLTLMGAWMGKLHSLPVGSIKHEAARTKNKELTQCLVDLRKAQSNTTLELQPLVNQLESAIQLALESGPFDQVLIHNDAHPGNMIMSGEDQNKTLTLIDWDGTGLGSRSEELGFLLYSCMPRKDSQQPDDWWTCILSGYARYSKVPQAEQVAFESALRYRPLTYLVDRVVRDPKGTFLTDQEYLDWMERYRGIEMLNAKLQKWWESHG